MKKKIKMKENLKLWRIKAKIQKYELKIYKSQILNNKQKKTHIKVFTFRKKMAILGLKLKFRH